MNVSIISIGEHKMLISRELLWERKKVVLSSLGFLVPAILHYKKNEVFQGFLLMLMSICSLQFYLLYKGSFKISVVYISVLSAVYGTLFYQGVIYRPDITSTFMWILLLVHNGYKGYKIQRSTYSSLSDALHAFMKWDIYLCLLCLGNYYMRDVSHAIVWVDFIKGMFWAWCLGVSYVLDINEFLVGMFWTQMAPFKPTKMDIAMKKSDVVGVIEETTEDDLD